EFQGIAISGWWSERAAPMRPLVVVVKAILTNHRLEVDMPRAGLVLCQVLDLFSGMRLLPHGPRSAYCLGMRTLHPAYRITDLATSLAFYGAVGFEQVGRVDLGDGVTLTMLKFPADEVVTLELVHRPADGPVVIGSGFSHLAVQVDDLAGMIEAVTKAGLS